MYLPTILNASMLFNASSDCLPRRGELPAIPGAPLGAAWFWGPDDELGRLNMLTPERTAAASKLIKSGQVVNLDLRVDVIDPPTFDRIAFNHSISDMGLGLGWDDEYVQNPQSTSHWDGFRHVGAAFNDEPIFYNNITAENIQNAEGPGVVAWANHGIVGRGVLLDYWTYANKSYDPFSTHSIPLQELLACARSQNVTFQYGDIVIIRSGWTEVYQTLNTTRRENLGGDFVGVERSEEMIDWLHDNYFAAVAGDHPAFEAYGGEDEISLHSIMLPLWGLPIGELWYLDELAEVCKEKKRYEFFFASSPANVPGGVASLANALAVF